MDKLQDWLNKLYNIDPNEPYDPKTHDFRAQSRFHPQSDGLLKIDMPPVVFIDPRDRIILDPIL